MSFSEELKLKVRKKAHFTCCMCKAIGVEIHHIIPQEQGGADSEDNAAPLCPSCHETYGANPEKRKFIREVRDFWYEICEKRYAPDSSKLDDIINALEKMISYEDFQRFKEELKDELLIRELFTPRSETEIQAASDELLDKIWYNRHLYLRAQIESGEETVNSEVWSAALKAAKLVEEKYGKRNLEPWSDFDWGMLNGKLSALRWVLGDEWDFLDT
jgi:hypothetical protein